MVIFCKKPAESMVAFIFELIMVEAFQSLILRAFEVYSWKNLYFHL